MHTITFETRAHCPDQIRGGRNPWTGTVQELIGFSEPAIQGEVVHEMLTRGTITQGQYDAADGYIGDLIEFLTIEDLRSLADDPNLTRTNTKTAPYPGISQPGTGRCLMSCISLVRPRSTHAQTVTSDQATDALHAPGQGRGGSHPETDQPFWVGRELLRSRSR